MQTLIPRRLMLPILFAIVLILGILFVFWIARSVGIGNIGQFYGQADELLENEL